MKTTGIVKKMAILAAVCVVITACGAAYDNPEEKEKEPSFNEVEWEEFKVIHEPTLDSALKAYNDDNAQEFAKNFITSRQKRTERSFKFLWTEDYKSEFGDFISKEFFPEKSNSSKVYPLLTYKAKFGKNDEVGVRCVFAKDEDGKYRIFYLRIDPYKDLFY